jgi:DNA polymerase IIIc chi subunit
MTNAKTFPNQLSINQFREKMLDTYLQALEIQKISRKKHVIVRAPVKSGKRMLKIIQALQDASRTSPARHIYITALNRLDARVQLAEMKQYGILCVCVTNPSSLTLEEAMQESRDFSQIVIHFDEADYGTGKNQKIDQTKLLELAKRDSRVKVIFYSATNEEIETSKFRDICEIVTFVPAANYRGSKWFLSQKDYTGNTLVEEAQSLWDYSKKDFTPHGKQVLQYFVNAPAEMSIGVARISADKVYPKIKPGGRQHETFMRRLDEMKILVEFVDESKPLQWGRDDSGRLSPLLSLAASNREYRTLLVINQTCTRSTEVGFHSNIAFWHDYRGIPKSYNTIIQASLRVAHYVNPEKYAAELKQDPSFGHRIKLWTHVGCIRRNADEISDAELYVSKLRPSVRIQQSTEPKYNNHERVVLSGVSPSRFESMDDSERMELIRKQHPSLPARWTGTNITRIGKRGSGQATRWVTGEVKPDSSDYEKHRVSVILTDEAHPKRQVEWQRDIVSRGLENKCIVIYPKTVIDAPKTKLAAVNSAYNN